MVSSTALSRRGWRCLAVVLGFVAGLTGLSTDAMADSPNYRIINYNSAKCMDVQGPSTANGATIHQWTCHGGTNQQWRFQQDWFTDGYFLMVAAHSNKCADVAGVSTSNGARVHQWACHNGANQQWSIGPGPSGFPTPGAQYRYQIRNRHSGKCLEVANGSTGQGAIIRQWTCNGGLNQLWIVVP
jgi:ricin-type beta-trefoil lectin protein